MKQTIPKKLASGVVAAAMTLSLLPAAALAADSEYSTSGATGFAFTDSGIAAEDGSYTGYKISGTDLTIQDSGTYIVSGNCSDGSITIKKGTTGVTLVLDGLTLTSEDTAPIACNKSSEVKIVAASGTTNALTGSAKNNDDNYPDNENAENAVIKCKDGSTVTLCGTGTLNITANGKNGIKSGATTADEGEASLTIRGLTLNITAPVNDAINAEQTLNIESGTLNISSGDDAIHCDYVMNVGASGTMGPSITIKACYEGLEAATLNILSGNISILSEDECLNAANSDLTGYSFSMTISGGAITAYSSTGDGFDSNGDLTITGGTVLAAGGSAGMGVPISAAQPYVTFGSTGAMGGGQMGGSGAPSTLPGGTNGEQPPAQPDGSDSSNGSSAPQPVQSCGFTDVAASDWFYSAVRYAYENGLMTGTGSGAFSPNATITRGMLVTILYRLEDKPAVTAANPFTDVSSGSYCEKAAAWAAANGIVGGYGDGRFGPNDALTREQLAAILYRYAQYKGYDLSASADPSGYSDQAGISAFARTAMAWANAEGLITGTSGSLLSPKGTATRAQTAMILMRFCQKV